LTSFSPCGLDVSGLGLAHQVFELGEDLFDGVQVGAVERQEDEMSSITPHVLRHSFASTANDLGFTEATIAAMLGHSRGTVTSRYLHHVDAALVAAADAVASQISSFIEFGKLNEAEYAAEARPQRMGTGRTYPAIAE
jgi:hypothetical protein